MTGDIETKAQEALQKIQEASDIFEQVDDEIENRQKEYTERFTELAELPEEIDEERIKALFEQQYIMLPKGKKESWVVVPRMFDVQIGWLHTQNEAFNVFVVNKYVDWIMDLPDEIKRDVGIEQQYDKAVVKDGIAEFASEEEADVAYKSHSNDFTRRVSGERNKIHIKDGKEFDVIADLIDDGNLPFERIPVQDDDLRPEPDSIELRSYQKRAWEKFVETGMVGIYWPPSAGKTFVSMYAGERLQGKKLVVVPSSTLEEQWEQRISEFCDRPREWEVRTYQYISRNLDSFEDASYTLTIFDECHHLPANTFSKLATVDTKYRMGLSASPYREDGRTEYIFALTGFPVGLKWQELIKLGVVDEPDVKVYLYSTKNRKRKDLKKVVNERKGKVLVFCDSIKEGKRISDELDVPFVHGETTERMEIFEDNRVVVVSRVGDEGISLEELDHVIEFDFHGSSRRQQAQRVGRVMHGESRGEHVIMMTDEELEDYGDRLYSIEEQGFNIRHERRR